jgi:hypothetical protein
MYSKIRLSFFFFLFITIFSFQIFAQIHTIESIHPSWGPPEGGTDIIVKGTNFTSAMTVYIKGIECINVVVVDSETITATTPDLLSNGICRVRVQNTIDSTNADLNQGFSAIGTIYYISESGDDANNGTDPSTPKLSIQKLIDETMGAKNPPPNPIEIRLEQGTYPENLWMRKKVVLTGGWSPGFTARDSDQYITVLDGDYDDMCARTWGRAAAITIDGVTMINGRRVGAGGGYRSLDDFSTLSNNIIMNNRSEFHAGGIYLSFNDDETQSVINSNIIIGNRTDYNNGGGVCVAPYGTYDAIPDIAITNSYIVGNKAKEGGAIWLYPDFNEYDLIQIKNNVIAKNKAESGKAGAILFSDDLTIDIEADLKNNLVRDNESKTYGGGIAIEGNGEGTFAITHHTFTGNKANWFGDGIAVYDSNQGTVDVKDSIFYFNNGDDVYDGPGTALITYSDIEEGFFGAGNLSVDPLFASGPLGDYYLSQMATGDPDETMDSSCMDSGSGLSADYVMDSLITRTDEVSDSGMVDLGYHYGTSNFPDPPDLLGITSILPGAGNFRGDDWIVIRGSGFVPGTRIFVDNVESGDVIVLDDRKLLAEVPPSVGEKRDFVDVEVRKPDDAFVVEVDGFQYVDVMPPLWNSTVGIQTATDAKDCQRGIILEWNNANDLDSPPVTYNIYRTEQDPFDLSVAYFFIPTKKEYPSDPNSFRFATFLANVPDLTYMDTDVSGGPFWYIVEALDSAEIPNRELNGVISSQPGTLATTNSSDTTPPDPVGNTLLMMTPDGGTTIHLDWIASVGAFKYNVYRGTDASTLDDPINLLHTTDNAYTTEYDDTGATGDLLFFKIKATDSCNPTGSPPGNEADE